MALVATTAAWQTRAAPAYRSEHLTDRKRSAGSSGCDQSGCVQSGCDQSGCG